MHAEHGSAASDEVALQEWWRRFGDPLLDRLIEAVLQQGIELSAAALRLQRTRAALLEDDGNTNGHEEVATTYRGWIAVAEFYAVRVQVIAATARAYFALLSLQERAACADDSIVLQQALLRRSRSLHEGDAATMEDARLRHAALADIHAHKIRLDGESNAAVIALARLLGEPLDLIATRVAGRMLPAAAAEMPVPGAPQALLYRRPDILAALHAAHERSANASSEARLSALAYEHRVAVAMSDVERTLALLSAGRAELSPVRAAALSADAQARRLQRQLHTDSIALEALLEAERMRHARNDREIETRGRTYAAAVDLFEALGAGWPAPVDTDPTP